MSQCYPESVLRLIEQLAKMPGVGEKTAERLAYHILRLPTEEAAALTAAIRDAKEKVTQCSVCYQLSESDPCLICEDGRRDRRTICVVEQARDVIAVEQSGCFHGVYHVLCGRLAPLDGIEPEDLTVADLVRRVTQSEASEVIVATNADMEGEATALYVHEALKGLPVKVTRLARGIPSGSSIEYADAAVLTDALEGRTQMQSRARSGRAANARR